MKGVNCIRVVNDSDGRLDMGAFYDKNPTIKDKIYCKMGGLIDEYKVNPREFGLNMIQLEHSDANQVLSLVMAKHALAGTKYADDLSKKKRLPIGAVLGIGGGLKLNYECNSRLAYPVVENVLRNVGLGEAAVQNISDKYKSHYPEWKLDSFPGMLGNVVSGRVAASFNMGGMNCCLDAACASSLAALSMAMDEVQSGTTETMLTGSTCTDNSVHMYMAFSKTPVFAKDEKLRAYIGGDHGDLVASFFIRSFSL